MKITLLVTSRSLFFQVCRSQFTDASSVYIRLNFSRRVAAILVEDVPKLGLVGDEVLVKPGYMRNYLYMQRKAVYATTKNRSVLAKAQVFPAWAVSENLYLWNLDRK